MAAYDVDVLIVGAGPTGLMLANELTAFGVSIRIVDKAPVRSDKSRAILVQSRGLELLDRHGLARALVARGTVGQGIDIHVYGKHVASLDTHNVGFKDTAFPGTLLASQADTEDLLETHLLSKLAPGHRGIERPATIDTVAPDDAGVDVVLVHGEEEDIPSQTREALRCRYVVGCDGARSSVRQAAGIPFEGEAYLQSFMLCDTHIANWPSRRPGRIQMFWDQGFLTLMPYAESRGVVRLVACKPVPLGAAAEERERLEQPSLDAFSRVFADTAHFRGPDTPQLRDPPVWLTSFRLHHRCAAAYRAGRLLIAGDAAHIHSPAGGQGMNTGLGDAANLGWKLAAAVRAGGSAGAALGLRIDTDALLSSYDAERRPVGERLLRTTDHLFILATTPNRFYAWLRNAIIRWVVPVVLRFRRRRLLLLGALSQLRVRYRRSPVVASAPGWKGVVRGGDRAPDGRVVPLSAAAAAGASSISASATESAAKAAWLLDRLWQGGKGITSYHLLLFTGAPPAGRSTVPASAAAAAAKTILAAADSAAATLAAGVDMTVAHILAGSAGQAEVFTDAETESSAAVFLDQDGYLHERYGFSAEPGYALVRPDGHVEHVGLLASLPQLAAWLQTRGEAGDGKVKAA